MSYVCKVKSPVGEITVSSDGEHITGLWIEGQKYFAITLKEGYEERELPVFQNARRWLDSYFAGEEPKIENLSLKPDGSGFRQAVWKVLCEIPYGETVTYGDIAKKLGCKSAQAIGGRRWA
jgi:methylated-DNA-[protein]-cysteine S-methyltransferase